MALSNGLTGSATAVYQAAMCTLFFSVSIYSWDHFFPGFRQQRDGGHFGLLWFP